MIVDSVGEVPNPMLTPPADHHLPRAESVTARSKIRTG